MPQDQNWLQVVGWPALIASVPGAIGVWQWWVARVDRRAAAMRAADDIRKQEDMTVQQRRDANQLAERAALTEGMSDLLERTERDRDRAETDVERARERARELERDRDRGWNLGRFYHRQARDMFHTVNSARQLADEMARRLGMAPIEWEALPHVPLNMEDVP